jgi:hypothetical protein
MPVQERRFGEPPRSTQLRAQLNQDQQLELATLERFGWELKFIRHIPFQPSLAVVFDCEHQSYAVLRADGSLDEHVSLQIRH